MTKNGVRREPTKKRVDVKDDVLPSNGNKDGTREDGGTNVHVEVAYFTTALRIALPDRKRFNRILRDLSSEADERIPQHELFALIVDMAGENFEDVVARWKERSGSFLAERAARASAFALGLPSPPFDRAPPS